MRLIIKTRGHAARDFEVDEVRDFPGVLVWFRPGKAEGFGLGLDRIDFAAVIDANDPGALDVRVSD